MYFSKITLKKSAGSLDKISSYINKDGYGYHQLIWNLFSENNPTKKRDFIYRAEFYNAWPSFYAVSKTCPIDQDNIWDINKKNYDLSIERGELFYFMLRVNPRIQKGTGKYKNKCIDIVQQYFCDFRNNELKPKSDIIQSAGMDWILNRSKKKGFTIHKNIIIVNNFEKHVLNKLKQKNPISFSTVDFQGQLKVEDSEKFIQTLYNGIGAQRSFGCGLLLIKR